MTDDHLAGIYQHEVLQYDIGPFFPARERKACFLGFTYVGGNSKDGIFARNTAKAKKQKWHEHLVGYRTDGIRNVFWGVVTNPNG